MFFEKYENKRKLGSGAFGHVYLVEDKEGKQYALKLISLDAIRKQSYLQDYLEGEIECMQTMNSPYIIKLYETLEDKKYKYLILEYCNGGDLAATQATFKDKVFDLDNAVEILADVIRGLEYLHNSGYIHRDLKLQNVLKSTKKNKSVYKLADFGFSKPQKDCGGTNLGTEQFKAPEIFKQQNYGYGVDMWAFGVTFYFMLNLSYPFKLNIYHNEEKKAAELSQAAENFSYSALVKKTKLKKTANCTPEMEDLFKRMFQVDPEKRLSFVEIREHPIFAKQFPVIEACSRILYKSRYPIAPSKITKSKLLQIPQSSRDQMHICSRIYKPSEQFAKEKSTLGRVKDQLDFLRDTAELFLNLESLLKTFQIIMISFNILKYYIILMRSFQKNLNIETLNQIYPDHKWSQYRQTQPFKAFLKEISSDLTKYQMKFTEVYIECQLMLFQIKNVNPSFEEAYKAEIDENSFEGAFKESYRKSVGHVYRVLRQKIKAKERGDKICYVIAMTVIAYGFNYLYNNLQNIKIVFSVYLKKNYQAVKNINYSHLKQWLSEASEIQLAQIAKTIISTFF